MSDGNGDSGGGGGVRGGGGARASGPGAPPLRGYRGGWRGALSPGQAALRAWGGGAADVRSGAGGRRAGSCCSGSSWGWNLNTMTSVCYLTTQITHMNVTSHLRHAKTYGRGACISGFIFILNPSCTGRQTMEYDESPHSPKKCLRFDCFV